MQRDENKSGAISVVEDHLILNVGLKVLVSYSITVHESEDIRTTRKDQRQQTVRQCCRI